MTTTIARTRVIQLWFSMMALLSSVWFTFGTGVSVGTGTLLFALSLVPVGIVLLRRPGVPPLTAGDIIRGK